MHCLLSNCQHSYGFIHFYDIFFFINMKLNMLIKMTPFNPILCISLSLSLPPPTFTKLLRWSHLTMFFFPSTSHHTLLPLLFAFHSCKLAIFSSVIGRFTITSPLTLTCNHSKTFSSISWSSDSDGGNQEGDNFESRLMLCDNKILSHRKKRFLWTFLFLGTIQMAHNKYRKKTSIYFEPKHECYLGRLRTLWNGFTRTNLLFIHWELDMQVRIYHICWVQRDNKHDMILSTCCGHGRSIWQMLRTRKKPLSLSSYSDAYDTLVWWNYEITGRIMAAVY